MLDSTDLSTVDLNRLGVQNTQDRVVVAAASAGAGIRYLNENNQRVTLQTMESILNPKLQDAIVELKNVSAPDSIDALELINEGVNNQAKRVQLTSQELFVQTGIKVDVETGEYTWDLNDAAATGFFHNDPALRVEFERVLPIAYDVEDLDTAKELFLTDDGKTLQMWAVNQPVDSTSAESGRIARVAGLAARVNAFIPPSEMRDYVQSTNHASRFVGELNKRMFPRAQVDSERLGQWAPLTPILETGEAGTYDTLYSNSEKPDSGHPWSGTKITQMTINQVLKLGSNNPPSAYRKWVKKESGENSAPMGKYQFVPTTLRKAVELAGLKGNERFDEGVQDLLFVTWIDKVMQSVSTPAEGEKILRKQWPGLFTEHTIKRTRAFLESKYG